MTFEDKFTRLRDRHAEIGAQLAKPETAGSDEFARLSKEYADLAAIVGAIDAYRKVVFESAELELMASDEHGEPDLRQMAREELVAARQRIPELEQQVRLLLIPKDEADEKNAILEVRAGTGGEEAALFASVLLRMYQRFAEIKGWRFEIMSANDTGIGGIKEASAAISGRGVFARLKFESGVHRVQRVPETEASGRIHTSAATVAVLPEAEDVDIRIEEKDLRIDVFRSSGPGGQSVNTTDSAVRVTHLPTGIVVSQQDEKSQHKNRAKAMKILRARLYDLERERTDAERAANRKSQVGTGDRSQRIRTYNFPQSRVTDHRIGLTLHKLEQVLDGDLDELIDALVAEDQAARLADAE